MTSARAALASTSSRLLFRLHLGRVIVIRKDVVEHVGDEFELVESGFEFNIGAVLRLQNEGRALGFWSARNCESVFAATMAISFLC